MSVSSGSGDADLFDDAITALQIRKATTYREPSSRSSPMDLSPTFSHEEGPYNPPAIDGRNGSSSALVFFEAVYDYTPTEAGDLAFKKGDIVEYLGKSPVIAGWHRGRLCTGENLESVGLYPANGFRAIDSTEVPAIHRIGSANVNDDDISLVQPAQQQEETADQELDVVRDNAARPYLEPPAVFGVSEQPSTVKSVSQSNDHQAPDLVEKDYLTSPPVHQKLEDQQATPPPPLQKPTERLTSGLEPADHPMTIHQYQAQLFEAAKGELFYTTTQSQDSTQPNTAVLSIAVLQDVVLRQLQFDISVCVAKMYDGSQAVSSGAGTSSLADLTNKYCDAVRNLDYMKQRAIRGYEEDPFLMKSSRALERSAFELGGLIPSHVLPAGPLPIAKHSEGLLFRDVGRNKATRAALGKKRLVRFTMAALGGLLLVIPVLIMANVPGKIAGLITTCTALLIFSLLVTWQTELGPNEVFATSAAYAAVLVVCVWTSL